MCYVFSATSVDPREMLVLMCIYDGRLYLRYLNGGLVVIEPPQLTSSVHLYERKVMTGKQANLTLIIADFFRLMSIDLSTLRNISTI